MPYGNPNGTNVNVIADSVNPGGKRITTFLCTYHRYILAEINTHRALSRNTASSRAIPIGKMLERVKSNPALPIRWGKNGSGMQDHGEMSADTAAKAKELWLSAAENAMDTASDLAAAGLHKQWSGRILEPFSWTTSLITATDWENFFSLRVHKDAQPEFQHLAHLMLTAYVNNKPTTKNWMEWHIPYGDRMPEGISTIDRLKVATARAARTSYLTMDGHIDIEKDIQLHDSLDANGHRSPFEHCARALWGRFANFEGWEQYRAGFKNENRMCNLEQHLNHYESETNTCGKDLFYETPTIASTLNA